MLQKVILIFEKQKKPNAEMHTEMPTENLVHFCEKLTFLMVNLQKKNSQPTHILT